MKLFFSLLLRNPLTAIALIVFGFLILLVCLTPWLGLQNPDATNTANKFLPVFSPNHFLGTDHLGRDLFSRLMWGTQLSLLVGISASIGAAVIGSAIGIVAGYFGGRVDNLFMRTVDMLMAFPYILLALAIVAALGPGLMNALIAVVAVNIPFFARNIRGVTVGIAHKEFIDAARLAGMSHFKIILFEVLPNVIPIIVVAMSTTIGWMILETAGLSFLGLGSQPPQADLGSMLGEARNALISYPHASVVPGLMIFLIVICVNLLGDGIRDALDPRLKSGALSRPAAATKVNLEEPNAATPDHPRDALLSVSGLHTRFYIGQRVYKASNGVSFHIKAGECLGIVGESGSGKSVTALSIMGLIPSPPGVITGGSIQMGGEELIGMPYQRLRQLRGDKVAYIFQDPLSTLHPLLKIGEQLTEAILVHHSISKSQARKKAIDLMEAVHIPNAAERINAYPHELSGGMRQRIAIAMALINDPELIIADEPTTALDVTVQGQILALLDELRRERGVAILFITHDFGVVSQLCDRVAVMYAGEIVEEGSTQNVLALPKHPYTHRLIQCVPELGRGKTQLHAIEGLPPLTSDLPIGCNFAARCSKATETCRQQSPNEERSSDRFVRCHFPEGSQA
ncbi:putative ABC-type dipeptide/oligopeptide/nickel transport system, permease/ATP-binding components [Vibrio nigripulchritudo MADA3029]|uniref:dipeptide/oligopeptide/nickel ABC transporter permease/ATP-binding protein n=1 Tax=Vibrio nigripulchritudo TaxID=28173 RepID=UPI0003B237C4|nr:dipeptide/oligopeptide/nickel ABC transporter permease/ATP-binding protein [Vibrio nigripulchritudo]CCN45489.1 putative ABC-type dipeptide/oligopeptide/nickel transport system, permease/ATP-binding components [Vibrio nigripulchritudo MADA3020]CCN55741.1 putative ABC-type dipeptide/oligopeptide/nickel transport system, permease/ATP-binding components [Vibrio nigripulchritudo MADA3021]CCN56966.1 putative ABC-type dipeptide/oligopeptide/nickel transport system, permease/ATP-binding components [V